MPREIELRFCKGVELRLVGDENAPVLEGHIAVFNVLSEDLGGFREQIAPGAFLDSLARDDVRALWNHEDDLVLGRTSAGTLDLAEDATGLAFRNTPPDTTWFKDRAVSLKRRDVTGASFGFYTEVDEWAKQPDGSQIRTLKKVTLVEVSPGCTFPAYPQTSVALRSLEAWRKGQAQALVPGPGPENLVAFELRRRRLQLMRHAL